MGVSGIWQWVIVLLIILLIFGTKHLRNVGSDLGSAIKGFRKGMSEGGEQDGKKEEQQQAAAVEKAADEGKERRDGGKADG